MFTARFLWFCNGALTVLVYLWPIGPLHAQPPDKAWQVLEAKELTAGPASCLPIANSPRPRSSSARPLTYA